jgi:hypothetical protein
MKIWKTNERMETFMAAGDIAFLVLVVGALSLFAGALAYGSWVAPGTPQVRPRRVRRQARVTSATRETGTRTIAAAGAGD